MWEFWAIHCLHTQHSVPVSCTIYRIFWLLSFLHLALWYNYATWINEMQTFQINTLIQFFNFWHFLHVSNCPQKEPLMFETCRRRQNLNKNINLKNVHFVGSCCIRIFWHYGQRKQTSPCLIVISLLFDDSYKGTCPSYVAVVLSGRQNTHLVTLPSMSVAQQLLALFQHPSVF
jgi:hypothetical protein